MSEQVDAEFGKAEDYEQVFCSRCDDSMGCFIDVELFGHNVLCEKCILHIFPENTKEADG